MSPKTYPILSAVVSVLVLGLLYMATFSANLGYPFFISIALVAAGLAWILLLWSQKIYQIYCAICIFAIAGICLTLNGWLILMGLPLYIFWLVFGSPAVYLCIRRFAGIVTGKHPEWLSNFSSWFYLVASLAWLGGVYVAYFAYDFMEACRIGGC